MQFYIKMSHDITTKGNVKLQNNFTSFEISALIAGPSVLH